MNLKWIGVPLRLLTEKGRVPKRQSANQSVGWPKSDFHSGQ